MTRVLGVLGILGLGIALAMFAWRNLSNYYFWTDESSTFLTALGWPAPGAPAGGLSDILLGLQAFVDPGGYQLMVRVWLDLLGTSIQIVRLLPFLFFVTYIAGLLVWFRLVGSPWIIAAGGVAVMLLENISPYYAVELRPYSAILAAAILLPLATLWLIRYPDIRRLIVFSVAFIALISVHFGTTSTAIACSGLLLVAALARRDWQSRVIILIGSLVTIATLPVIHLLTRGNPFADQEVPLTYMTAIVMKYQSLDQILSGVLTNLFSLSALPRTVFLVLVPAIWLTAGRRRKPSTYPVRVQVIAWLWLYVLIGVIASAGLSLLGFLPWVLGTRWSIAEVGYIALSIVGLIGLALLAPILRNRAVGNAVVVLAVIACLIGDTRIARYSRQNDVDYLSALAPVILSGEPNRAIVDQWIFGDVRYWMEFSGQHDDLQDEWIAHKVRGSSGYTAASAADIQDFLHSDNDRFLLRSKKALDESGITLPPEIEVVTVPPEAAISVDVAALPVVLVRAS